jgi:DNA-directed RNA polymerase subunit K/omega
MSDIEDDLFNNSDDDGSDEDSVVESDVDYDEQNVIDNAKPKLTIGNTITNKDVDYIEDNDEEVYEDVGSEDEADVEAAAEDDDEVDDDDGEASDDENVGAATATREKRKTPSSGPSVAPGNIYESNLVGDTDEDNDEDDDGDDDDEDYLQKFDTDIKKNYVVDFHPECMIHNYEEISALTKVVRDKDNIIVDRLHRTIPYLTKYERTRVLGQRAKQINLGARPFVKVPENIIDGHLVAEMELVQKRIPFIIRRPLPGNSGSEYWNLKDLEIITF